MKETEDFCFGCKGNVFKVRSKMLDGFFFPRCVFKVISIQDGFQRIGESKKLNVFYDNSSFEQLFCFTNR